MLYFDYSASTPMSAYALETYKQVATDFYANSRSLHTLGEESDDVLSLSRKTIAKAFDAKANEIYFTGSGSEAIFLALTGLALSYGEKGKNIVTTKGEHQAVAQTLDYLTKYGFTITYVPVNEYGVVTKSALKSVLTDDTFLVTIAHANSEIGTVQDLVSLGTMLKKRGILFHSDCVQTFGKLPIPTHVLTSASVSAHKCYGPKGVGAAFMKETIQWTPFLKGTTHEDGFRPGTVDVPGIAAFAAAIDEYGPLAKAEMERLSTLRKQFISAFSNNDRVVFEGHPTMRLPFHISLRVKEMEGQLLMLELKRKGIAISTGSACRVGETDPPNTLISIGRTAQEAHELVRITFGRWTTKKDVTTLIHAINEVIDG